MCFPSIAQRGQTNAAAPSHGQGTGSDPACRELEVAEADIQVELSAGPAQTKLTRAGAKQRHH